MMDFMLETSQKHQVNDGYQWISCLKHLKTMINTAGFDCCDCIMSQALAFFRMLSTTKRSGWILAADDRSDSQKVGSWENHGKTMGKP